MKNVLEVVYEEFLFASNYSERFQLFLDNIVMRLNPRKLYN